MAAYAPQSYGAERRKSLRDADAKAQLMSQLTPFFSQRSNRRAAQLGMSALA